jgi:hypothetical protein
MKIKNIIQKEYWHLTRDEQVQKFKNNYRKFNFINK